MRLGDNLGLDDLPAVPFTADGETHLKPCAEALLPDRVARSMMDCGLIPVLSVKHRNAVRLPQIQSIAATEGKPQERFGPFQA